MMLLRIPTSTQDVFPLLQLPLLAREQVFGMMTPFELIDLSMTSSKAKSAVIFFSKIKPRFRVHLEFWGHTEIRIEGQEEEWKYIWTSHIQFRDNPIRRLIYSEKPFEDCMKWYEDIKGVIGGRIFSLKILGTNTSKTNWLRSQQESIDNVKLWFCFPNHVKYFLETIRVTGVLHIEVRSMTDSLSEIPDGPYILLIKYPFLCYEQLISIKSSKILLRNSRLKNQEINGFLKSWMTCESHLNLKLFGINVSGPGAVNEILDLPCEMTTDPNILTKFEEYPFYTKVTRGFKIERCDGRMATACVVYQEILELPEEHALCLIVH
uniref:FBA_2 domain-containing protein n=1 Tax=Caenorhabditis tropicalis TaxID=1561998 RepID=A0A1I7TUK1_9PELO